MSRKNQDSGTREYDRFVAGFREATPDIYDYLNHNSEDFHSLRFYGRGKSDVMAVGKRYSDSGDIQVVFGSGHDFFSALLALDGAMRSNRWRNDVPWADRVKV